MAVQPKAAGDLWDRQAALYPTRSDVEKCHECDRVLVDPIEIEVNVRDGYEWRQYCSIECVGRDVGRGIDDEQ